MSIDLLFSVMGSVAVVAVIMISFLVSFIFYHKKEPKQSTIREKFFKNVENKFRAGLIKGRDDITILRNSIARDSYREYPLVPLLEDYLTYLTSKEEKGDEPNNIKSKYDLIREILEEESKEKPFTEAPEEERRLLINLSEAIEKGNKSSSEYNLHELSSLICRSYKNYMRTHKVNKWAIPLAVCALATTILFGTLSFTNRVNYHRIREINRELIEKPIENPNPRGSGQL